MASEWVRLCRTKDFSVDEPHIEVNVHDGRRHRITINDEGESYRLSAFVVRQAVVSSVPDVPIQAWLRNRVMLLVGFRIDERGRVVAEAWVPKAGLTQEEFQLYVRTVAVESDRFEYALTGKDNE